jgi:MATE family multidrug resistance protein
MDYDADEEVASRQLFLDEDDEVSYNNYVPNTIDPGYTLFIIAVIISLCSIICVPLVAKLGKCIIRKYEGRYESGSSGDDFDGSLAEHDGNLVTSAIGSTQSQTDAPEPPSSLQRCPSTICSDERCLPDVVRLESSKRDTLSIVTTIGMRKGTTGRRVCRYRPDASRETASLYLHQMRARRNVEHDNQGRGVWKLSPLHDGSEKAVRPVNDPSGQSAIPSTQVKNSMGLLNESRNYLWTIVRWDHETKRILRLAVPFTFSAIANTASELAIVAIISHTLGTNAMVAYAMTFGLVGITFSFMGGWHEAVTSLVSMAYGAKNNELAGKYAQTACISYVLCEIPMAFIWVATMSKVLHLYGFDDSVAMMGQDFVWVRVLINVMSGVNNCILNFLAGIERDKFANIIYIVDAITKAGFVALAAYQFEVSLVVLGLVLLINATMVFSLIILIPLKMEWFSEFEKGLFGSCAWADKSVMKDVSRVALPLAFGSLLAYAEWEILIIFAAFLGPAEVATWAIMGFVWDVFESTTEAVCDASEIRVAYHLGKGRPSAAKLAGFKSMFFGAIFSIMMAIVFISLTDVLPSLLTLDVTIQNMLAELFPLVALGNITMSMGMVCWSIIGGQGRYHLSTLIALSCSFAVTIPIGAVVTIWMRIDLQGLAFAVVTGYIVTAMVLSACINISDWEMLSKRIQERVSADDDEDSSTSSSGSMIETQELPRRNRLSYDVRNILDVTLAP